MAALAVGLAGDAGALQITGFDPNASLQWTGAPVPGVCCVEVSSTPAGPWTPWRSAFATEPDGSLAVSREGGARFHRLRAVDVGPTPAGFSNLVSSYGLLETVAGNGAGQADGVSFWLDDFEGAPAEWVSLSRPHFALADRAGNIYIVDKNSHSVVRVGTDGRAYTHAGSHVGGFDGEGPAAATRLQLNFPNSLWVRGDGTVYVLDTGNGRVRRVDTNGVMQTLFLSTASGTALAGGRGLWVRDDEGLAYFCAETRVRSWTPTGGLKTLASGFVELGNLVVESGGDVLVCDRGGHRVYRVSPAGVATILAGNGTPQGGGDGQPGLATGLDGVRGIWPMPTGGYLLLTHDGCQLWYLDSGGVIHLMLNGAGGRTHDGDGLFFHDTSRLSISEGRSVALDHAGNILLCESDYGYVRRIRFERMASP